ncbi:MAG TPA: TonB-dependent receptor [Bacteroidales bacterium]|nr:TonB-dependent receptor [Bacteroidales bacterium]
MVLTGMINDVGAAIMTNVDKSYRMGIELTAGVKLNDMLYWSGNATFSRNKVKNFTEYVDNWDTWGQESSFFKERTLAFSPEFVAGSQLSFKYKPVEVAWVAKYVDKQYIDNSQSDERKLHAYFVNDIRVNTKLLVKSIVSFELIASINNIFNAKYEANAWVYQYIEGGEHKVMDGYFPQAGRNFMVGLIVKF